MLDYYLEKGIAVMQKKKKGLTDFKVCIPTATKFTFLRECFIANRETKFG